ncbi:MAG: RNA polymerase subunit sigma-24 [Candidatus Wallbacteria bacterium HGW-Wallbacteria-1]|jgi:RNA polymerase sigma-70 factor (ECF subfamily)|uniref:RNA polymerase subunit sigma-24 n=1 Tax=Candidatus Wallbacteria bacterium HGW-Wallbacteria-1 TaxID=2013854 RepID=A0A2N1PS74_9BACT|nr:MAG: RNA polymerase subunit sigma-24 [Candidatus Wallbacteria bacterium HGW-Wallbacteria-1]
MGNIDDSSESKTHKGMKNNDDMSLVSLAARGVPEAFEELLTRYEKRIFQLCLFYLKNHEEANDAAQETFIKVYKAIGRFKGKSKFYTWLYSIAVNTCKSKLKIWHRRFWKEALSLDEPLVLTDNRKVERLVADWSSNPERILIRAEGMDALRKAIQTLPGKYMLPVVLKDIQAISYEEISEILEINIGTVKSRLHRGRAMIAAKLESPEIKSRTKDISENRSLKKHRGIK